MPKCERSLPQHNRNTLRPTLLLNLHPRKPLLLWMESLWSRTATTLQCPAPRNVLPIWNGRSFTRTILCKRRPENPPNRHYQRRTSTISLPWANPSQLFNSTNHRNSTAINKWERAIICEWINPPQVMEKTAIAIAKE